MDDRRWTLGQRVVVRGGIWTIAERTAFENCVALRLSGAHPDNAGVGRTVLVPFDRPVADERAPSIRVLRPRRWLRALRRIAIDTHPFGGLSAAASSSIDLLPYQLEPALAMIRHAVPRVLIADGVGMGKTVQAGLIVHEIAARQESARALIVVPAGLREQWSSELATRFGLHAIVADASWLAATGRELPADVNPWSLPGIYLSSFDFIKRPEVLAALEETLWDLLIVDEAHQAALGTARRGAVHALATRARRVALLTATPPAGEPAQLEALCRIGLTDPHAERMTMFRRSRSDVGMRTARRSVLLQVRLSDDERRMHRLLDAYTSRICREAAARGDSRARLAAIVLRKRALSSAWSLAASCRRRLTLLSTTERASAEQLALPLADEDPLEDREPDAVLAVPGLADATRERRWLSAIAQAAQLAARHESKIRFLIRLLSRMREPAIVFTEYRDTLERLRRTLGSASDDVVLLHGGLHPTERAAAQRFFTERGTLLLATDAASEGLNLHHRCRTVVHFELPWSPMRLEQRTGRVDRLGQTRRVHEIVLIADDTAERVVLAPLARRAAIARSSPIGRSTLLDLLTESRVAGAVMEGHPVDDAPAPTSGADAGFDAASANLRDEAAAEAARLRSHRGWQGDATAGTAARNVVVASAMRVRRGDLAPGVVCVYALSLISADNSVAHAELIAARAAMGVKNVPRTPNDVRRFVHWFVAAREAAVDDGISRTAAARSAAISMDIRRAIDALERRERAIAVTLPSTAQQLVQAGLFDRRALLARAARTRAAGEQHLEIRRALDGLAGARDLSASLDLRAVLFAIPDAAR